MKYDFAIITQTNCWKAALTERLKEDELCKLLVFYQINYRSFFFSFSIQPLSPPLGAGASELSHGLKIRAKFTTVVFPPEEIVSVGIFTWAKGWPEVHYPLSYLVSHAYMLQDGTPFIYIFPARPYIQMYRPGSRTGNTQGRKSVPVVPWLDNKFLTLLCSCLLENMNIIRRNYIPFMSQQSAIRYHFCTLVLSLQGKFRSFAPANRNLQLLQLGSIHHTDYAQKLHQHTEQPEVTEIKNLLMRSTLANLVRTCVTVDLFRKFIFLLYFSY